jgi:O-antigen ligase
LSRLQDLGRWGLYLLAFASLVATAPAHLGAALALPAALASLAARRRQPWDGVAGLTAALAAWLLLRYTLQTGGLGEAGLLKPEAALVDWLFPLLFAPFALIAAEDRLRHLARLWLLALAGCTAGVAAYLLERGPAVLWSGARLGFHLDRPLGIGLYAGCFVVLLLGTGRLWWQAPGPWRWPARAGGLALLALYVQVLITAQSRSTYLALVAALAVLGTGALLLRRHRGGHQGWAGAARMAGLGVVLLAALVVANRGVIGERLAAEREVVSTLDRQGLEAAPASSITTRLRLWHFALDSFPEAPWIGHGLGSLVEVVSDRLGGRTTLMEGERYDHLHNSYLQLLWSQGLVGLALWGGLLIALLRDAVRAAGSDPRVRALLPAVGGGVTFVALWACFDYRLSHIDTRMFTLLALLSLRQLGVARPSP